MPFVRVRPTSPRANCPTTPFLAVSPKSVGEKIDATAKTGAALETTFVTPLTTFLRNLPSFNLKAVHLPRLFLNRFRNSSKKLVQFNEIGGTVWIAGRRCLRVVRVAPTLRVDCLGLKVLIITLISFSSRYTCGRLVRD